MIRKVLMTTLMIAAFALFMPMNVQAMSEKQVEELSQEVGEIYGICPEFLQAMAFQESTYQEMAENNGCSGLMQVSERWHKERMKRLKVTDLYEPKGNMMVAADYLAELFQQYDDPGMVLMVYNGDSDAQMYQETGKGLSVYAEKVLIKSAELERLHEK